MLFLGEGTTFRLGRQKEGRAEPGHTRAGAAEADAWFCQRGGEVDGPPPPGC